MISRYALYDTADLSKRFSLAQGLPKGVKPHYNLSPTIDAPVIINHEGSPTVKQMKWGLVAQGAKDTNSVFRYKTYNIPSEKILSRHSWSRAVRENRCLIPANGFYELNNSGKKRAFYVRSAEQPLIAFAGVYSSWQDPAGVTHNTYSMITTEATDDMPDPAIRMPIIIKRQDEARWLDPATTDATSLYDMLHPHAEGELTFHEVSPAIHSPKPNQPSLIEPIT